MDNTTEAQEVFASACEDSVQQPTDGLPPCGPTWAKAMADEEARRRPVGAERCPVHGPVACCCEDCGSCRCEVAR